MSWTASADFSAAATEVARSRSWLRGQLASVDIGVTSPDDDVIANSVLIVSELVTNSIRAGCSTVSLTLEVSASSVRILVRDDAPGFPRLAEPASTATHGRGLGIVATLSSDWGVQPLETGKTTWASVPR